MSEQDNARRAPMNYVATARAFCFDLAATAFLFVSASVMAGRVWRFPFDDEIATLLHIEPDAARELIENFPATTEIMSFVVLYLVPRHEWHRLWSALALGLAASTDFSAALIVPPFLIHRHLLQRRFRWSFDLSYWLIVMAGAAVGFCSAYWIFTYGDDSGGGGILPRCCPFRFDEYAWLLRWQCPRNQPSMDRHSDHHRFCPGGSLRNRSAKAR
jgi:hypothetical protein